MSYGFKRTITFDHTQVPSNQTNIPMVVYATLASLKSVGNGGNVQNASGYDIIFTSDSAGTNILPFERANWVATSGLIEFWIQIPTLSSSADTVIYMFYGNAAITTDQSNPTGVWDANYKAVYHLSNGTTLSAADSTGNHNGTINGATAQAVEIDGGASFDGTDDNIDLGAKFDGSNLTVEAWIQPTFAYTTPNYPSIGGNLNDAGNAGWAIYYAGNSNNKWTMYSAYSLGGAFTQSAAITSNGALGQGAPHMHVGRVNAGVPTYYIDNASVGSSTTNGTGSYVASTGNVQIGANPGFIVTTNWWNGYIDELRISNIARSNDWLTSQYNNTKNAASTPTIGSEQTASLSESITDNQAANWGDAVVINFGLPPVVLTDSFTFSDAQAYGLNYYFSQSDTLSFSDTFQPASTMDAFIDQLTLSDSEALLLAIVISISDTFTFTDAVKLLEIINVTESDTFTFSDSVQFNVPFSVAISDFFIWRDATTVAWSSVLPVLTDAFAWSDSVIVTHPAFWTPISKTITDDFAFTDSFNDTVGDNLVLSDILSLSDSITVFDAIDPTQQVFADSFGFSDSVLINAQGELLQFADSLTLSDNVLVNNTTSFNSYIRRYLNDEPDV